MRHSFAFAVTVASAGWSVVHAQPTPSGLLPIDQAYVVSAEANASGTVRVHFKIADGYYLYREQMKFASAKEVTLGTANLPDGKKIHDEFAGDVQIYHNDVDAVIPFTATPGAKSLKLTVGYQGCHEVEPKLCYPPHKKDMEVAVTSGVSAAAPAPLETSTAQTPPTLTTSEAKYGGTPEARAVYQKGEQAQKAGNFVEAVANYKAAANLDPNYADAHFAYVVYGSMSHVLTMGSGDRKQGKQSTAELKQERKKASALDKVEAKRIEELYQKLVAEHPDRAVYPWAYGLRFIESDLNKQQQLCEQSVKIDPSFAKGYGCLASLASLRVSASAALEYARKAFALAPDDQDIANSYAFLLLTTNQGDPTELRALLQKFPDSYGIGFMMSEHADALETDDARIAALEQIRKSAPAPDKPAAQISADYLYEIYLGKDLNKAKALCDELSEQKEGGDWKERAKFVNAMLTVQTQLEEKQPEVALATLKSVEKQKDKGMDKLWYLTQARALDASGKTKEAVSLLRDSFVAQPTDVVLAALQNYGGKIGKSPKQIGEEIWAGYQTAAKAPKPLALKRLDNGQQVSLADYKGKPVIVDFWYPQCGPCRSAFPYLQKVAAKYKDKGVTVLAISSIEEQQPYALPYLVQKKYDFLGLAGSLHFSDSWGVRAYPTTFLIGRDGKLYSEINVRDPAHQRSAELAVEQMLEHG